MLLTAAGAGFLWRALDPEGWKPFGAILAYWWVIFPAWLAFTVIDALLMGWFGRRKVDGKPEEYIDPTQARLDNIEAAINRLHNYVQELDPELQEEFELEREFMSGNGGMFAGMNHMEYVRDRQNAGKRTKYSDSIWRDPPENTAED
jgi:hypothetical protein